MPLPERELIKSIRGRARRNRLVRRGIGDDCAVLRLPPGHEALITTDFSLEGVHFRREWQSPECIGHRCLARGLSDIAAMSGEPIAAFLSLALPRNIPQRWVDRFLAGFSALAHKYRIEVAGGDTAQSPTGVLSDIVVYGSVPRGKALLRSGARPGDSIYVTGRLGESAAMLERLANAGPARVPAGVLAIPRTNNPADIFPAPRIAVGKWLREKNIASACIDISDGLSTDLLHICKESGVGAVISADAVPACKAKTRQAVGSLPLSADKAAPEFALHGGDDYELLFTSPRPKQVPKKIAGVEITPIGYILRGKPRLQMIVEGKKRLLEPRGWEHFRAATELERG